MEVSHDIAIEQCCTGEENFGAEIRSMINYYSAIPAHLRLYKEICFSLCLDGEK